MNAFFLVTGLVLGVLAGLCAFLITYEEDCRHYLDRQLPLRTLWKLRHSQQGYSCCWP